MDGRGGAVNADRKAQVVAGVDGESGQTSQFNAVGAFANGFEEDACIVEQVELGDEDFLLLTHNEDGQFAHLVVSLPGIALND